MKTTRFAVLLLAMAIQEASFAQLPVISSFSPSSGTTGTSVQISGNYFMTPSGGGEAGINPGDSSGKLINLPMVPPIDFYSVYFGDYQASPTYVSATYISAPVPAGIPPGSYPIKVYTSNGLGTSATNFTVPAPSVGNVAFLHGFNGYASSWQTTAQTVYNEFNVPYPTNLNYNSLQSVSTTASISASSLVPYSNTVVVGSSMGGVLAREIRRQQGSGSNVSALITVGTPHTGAPVANYSWFMTNLGFIWTNDLAWGWNELFYTNAFEIAGDILSVLLGLLNAILDPFNANSPGGNDLKPGSGFMNTLNANPSASLPPAHYAIWGREDWQSHWRLADAFQSGYETGNGYATCVNIIASYSWNAFLAENLADWSYQDWLYYQDYYYLEQYYHWLTVRDAFNWGAYAVANLHQQDFNYYILDEPLSAQDVYNRNPLNDGFIPSWSMAPSFIAADRRLLALHTNHAEQTTYIEPVNRLREALKKQDINVPLR